MISFPNLRTYLTLSLICFALAIYLAATAPDYVSAQIGSVCGATMEAENGQLSGGMVIIDDSGSSGGRHVMANEPAVVDTPSHHSLVLCFNVETAGTYSLVSRVSAPTQDASTIFIGIDTDATFLWQMAVGEGFVDQTVMYGDGSQEIHLATGQHSVTFYQHAQGVSIDQVSLVLQQADPVEEPTLEPTVVPTEVPTEEPTPTDIPPTATMAPTATALPNHDAYEPNNSWETATTILLGEKISDLTLDPASDQDFFKLYLKTGQLVEANTLPFGGIDPKFSIFDVNQDLIGSNDDRSITDTGSTYRWQATADGWYIILVESSIPIANGTYQLQTSLELPAPTATPQPTSTPGPTSTPAPTSTPVPTATPIQKSDDGEPNNRPEDAFGIIPGEVYQMTLGPVGYDSHDFFYLLGKAGVSYACEAINPSGVDPTMRVYIGEVGAGILIAQNDDISDIDIGSRTHFDITGIDMGVYIVVEDRIGSGSYEFSCYAKAGSYVSPSGGSAGSGATAPPAPMPTATIETAPVPTEEAGGEEGTAIEEPIEEEARLVPLNFSESTHQQETEEPVITTIEIVITYDQNNNKGTDPDEGIPNVSVRALDGNDPVGWAITNEQGRATMTLIRPVNTVTVPYLSGWTYRVRMGELNTVEVQVPAQPLPVIMPILEANNEG